MSLADGKFLKIKKLFECLTLFCIDLLKSYRVDFAPFRTNSAIEKADSGHIAQTKR